MKKTSIKKLAGAGASTSALASKAMLVNLSISYWTGKATDDSVIEELTTAHSTERDVHDYRKRLVKADAVNAFKAVRSKARAYHMDKTLPWIDGGTRVLPAKLYFDYAAKMSEFHEEYNGEVANFLKIFPKLKDEAKKRLGTLFKETDYPTAERLKQKFGWDMHAFPIPAKEDWRVSLGGKADAEIQKQIDDKVREAMVLATRDLWRRLHEVIQALSTKMREADPKFRDSIIGNVRDLLKVLPDMNVADDPELETMRKEIDAKLADVSMDALRDDPKARKKTADAADEILKKMAGYIGS
jgi:hypothetical protein